MKYTVENSFPQDVRTGFCCWAKGVKDNVVTPDGWNIFVKAVVKAGHRVYLCGYAEI